MKILMRGDTAKCTQYLPYAMGVYRHAEQQNKRITQAQIPKEYVFGDATIPKFYWIGSITIDTSQKYLEINVMKLQEKP